MIEENVKKLLNELPHHVQLEAAAKTQSAENIERAIKAGVKIIGQNYIKDIKNVYGSIQEKAEWHFIGTIQTQKHDLFKKKYLMLFDMIETLDSFEIAEQIDKKCAAIGKVMPVLIEINSAKEPQKSGIMPEDAEDLIRKIAKLNNIKVMGLMTMGPQSEDAENLRGYFKDTRRLFDELKVLNIPNTDMKYLSMGMTASYKAAVEEGANIVRIGTKIFGPRACKIKQ